MSNSVKFEFWANLRQIGQRGRDGQIGCQFLCTARFNNVAINVELLQLADLALTQRLAKCYSTFICKVVVAKPVEKSSSQRRSRGKVRIVGKLTRFWSARH